MIDKQALQSRAKEAGIDLPDNTAEKLSDYAELLVDWNQRMNLTAITQPQDIEDKHFLDCLQLADEPTLAGKLVDVGSGAGFPGLVVALHRPELQVTLMEPTGKRIRFLQEACDILQLQNVTLVQERAEEAARKQWRETFDVATARAVAALPALCEYCLPLVKPGGWFYALKGGQGEAEAEQASAAIKALGGRLQGIKAYTLPNGDARSIICIKKVTPTPEAYPRNGGRIKKKPIS